MSRRTVRFFVSGRVQGVGFRAFLVREGNVLGLVGWARNRADGSVEALATGSTIAVSAFLDMARRGPSASRVDRLWEEPADAAELIDCEGFEVAVTL